MAPTLNIRNLPTVYKRILLYGIFIGLFMGLLALILFWINSQASSKTLETLAMLATIVAAIFTALSTIFAGVTVIPVRV